MSRTRPTLPLNNKCRHHPKRKPHSRGVCMTCSQAGYAAIRAGEVTDEVLVEIGFWEGSKIERTDDSREIIRKLMAARGETQS